MTDLVNHPDHYGGDTTYEVIKVIHAMGFGFNLGNCFKYMARRGKKSEENGNIDLAVVIQDLKKAQFYLNYEIEILEGKREF